MRSQQNAKTEVNEFDRFERNVSKKQQRRRLAAEKLCKYSTTVENYQHLNILQGPKVEVYIILIHIRILCISS